MENTVRIDFFCLLYCPILAVCDEVYFPEVIYDIIFS